MSWCLVAFALSAAEPLSLQAVLESARSSFPTMLASRYDVETAEAELTQAQGAFDPAWRTRGWHVPLGGYQQSRLDSVIDVPTPLWGTNFFAGYRLGVGNIQSYYGERVTWSAGELRAGASVPLLRNGPIDRRRATIARAELARYFASLGVEQQRLEVERLASFRYWEWVAAGERRRITQQLLELARARDRQLRERAAAGEVSKFDQQDNLRALIQRETMRVQAERGLEQARLELSLYLRDAAGDPVMVDDDRLPAALSPEAPMLPPSDENALAQLLARRPDVQRLENQKKQQEVERSFTENQVWPAVDVGVAVSKDLGVAPSSSYSALGPTELELTASIDVPLLFRAPLGRARAVRASLSKLDAQLQLAKDRASVELRDAISALRAAIARVDLTRQEIEVALALESGETARFTLGETTLLFVTLREQTTSESRLRQVDALVDLAKATATLRATLALSSDAKL